MRPLRSIVCAAFACALSMPFSVPGAATAAPAGAVAPFADRGVLSTRGTFVAAPGGMATVAANPGGGYRVARLSDSGGSLAAWTIASRPVAACNEGTSPLSSFFDGMYDEREGLRDYRTPSHVALPSSRAGFFVSNSDVVERYHVDGTLLSATPSRCGVTFGAPPPYVADTPSGLVLEWSPTIRTGDGGRNTTMTGSALWAPDGSRIKNIGFGGEYDGGLLLDDGIVSATADGSLIEKRGLSGALVWSRDVRSVLGASACGLRFSAHRGGILVMARVGGAGCASRDDSGEYRVGRLAADGSVDTAFGSGGIIELPGLFAQQISSDPEGRVIVVAMPRGLGLGGRFAGPRPWVSDDSYSFPLPSSDIASVLRFTSDGRADETFGGPGVEAGTAPGRVDVPFALDVNSVKAESRSFVTLPVQYAANGDPLVTWPVENLCRVRPGLARPVGVTTEKRTIRLRADAGVAVVSSGQYGSLRNLTIGSDRYAGTSGCDIVRGLGGNDVIRTGAGRDVIHAGSRGRSWIDAGAGDDLIYPADRTPAGQLNVTYAGPGNDVVRGSQYGRNHIVGGPGRDIVRGGVLPDVFNVADGASGDTVYCTYQYVNSDPNSGLVDDRDLRDRVIRDPGDRAVGCNPRLVKTTAPRR